MEGWALVLFKKRRQTRETKRPSHFLLRNVPFLGGGGPKHHEQIYGNPVRVLQPRGKNLHVISLTLPHDPFFA